MKKHCPDCFRLMLLFDHTGRNQAYEAQVSIGDTPYAIGVGIDWESWPFQKAPPLDAWVCPRCGHHEPVGQDVIAQQEFRPRLF